MLALQIDATNLSAEGDFAYDSGTLTDSGLDLQTAIILSLFVDAEALPGDAQPVDEPRRGWWGNSFGAKMPGSRLWLLESMEASATTARLAETYASEALQWLVSDRIVRSISAVGSFKGEAVLLNVEITLKNGQTVSLSPFKVAG